MKIASNLQQAINYIVMLDFTYLVKKMIDESYPLPRWTMEDALHGLQLYKNFLILSRKHAKTQQPLIPTKEIDEFWHQHILHTRQYEADCQVIFGYYYHHDPVDIAKNSASERQKISELFAKTQQLYFEEFGEQL
jgi:hypothetical protein